MNEHTQQENFFCFGTRFLVCCWSLGARLDFLGELIKLDTTAVEIPFPAAKRNYNINCGCGDVEQVLSNFFSAYLEFLLCDTIYYHTQSLTIRTIKSLHSRCVELVLENKALWVSLWHRVFSFKNTNFTLQLSLLVFNFLVKNYRGNKSLILFATYSDRSEF